ncbi:CBS domain-containing protein [Propioniciclava soli]|uniref:CBS domain-containing protein n=1 Tax=Propioniciclava soli TaxID=2775081 RepID=A0ABZ3C973_9ACTN|nr:CBS domain-containing protein [Propioniciclava soli]
MKLSDVIKSKGNAVVTLSPDASVADLVALMAEHNIGAVVVSADGHHIDGIVSERDVVRGLAASGHGIVDATVRELMTGEVVTGTPEDPIEETAHVMTDKRVRHIPIVVNGELAALVSIGDVVKYRIDQLTDERNHLLGYLHT